MVLATLLILILVIRKMVRSGWMTKFVLRSEKQQGETYEAFLSHSATEIQHTSILMCLCFPMAAADLGEQFHTIIYFGFQTLRKATKNFHQDNFLGRGGFGLVYMVFF